MKNTYTESVSELFTLGEMDWDEWDDYSEFAFTKEHIPELIRLGMDRHLLVDVADVDDDEMWAPMHAWRILVQMRAMESIAPLTQVLDWSEETETDLISEGLTDALVKFGAPVIESLAAFMNEPGHAIGGYISASEVMSRIGEQQPEHRDRIIQILTSALDENFERNDEDVNGFWIADLLDLDAIESYPAIKKAFVANKVNLRVVGDLEDVEMEFGMRAARETPAPNLTLPLDFMRALRDADEMLPVLLKDEKKRLIEKEKKQKNKRKQEKKSRRKNRKRK